MSIRIDKMKIQIDLKSREGKQTLLEWLEEGLIPIFNFDQTEFVEISNISKKQLSLVSVAYLKNFLITNPPKSTSFQIIFKLGSNPAILLILLAFFFLAVFGLEF